MYSGMSAARCTAQDVFFMAFNMSKVWFVRKCDKCFINRRCRKGHLTYLSFRCLSFFISRQVNSTVSFSQESTGEHLAALYGFSSAASLATDYYLLYMHLILTVIPGLRWRADSIPTPQWHHNLLGDSASEPNIKSVEWKPAKHSSTGIKSPTFSGVNSLHASLILCFSSSLCH